MALITTLLMVVVLVMVIASAMKLTPGALSSSVATVDVLHANLAAEAGVNYARARLGEDMTWRGGADNGPTTVVRAVDGSMVVVEDRGNVVGLLKFGPSQFGQFRIRFNHQDGPLGGDTLPDPTSTYVLDLPLISQNNLLGGTATTLKEDHNGTVQDSQGQVAAFQAYLAVEGRAGPGLRDASLNSPNQAPSSLRLVRRVVETRLQGAFSDSLDAAAMAAGDFQVDITPHDPEPRDPQFQRARRVAVTGEWRKDSVPPRVRSKGSMGVTRPESGLNFYSPDGYVDSGNGTLAPGTVPNSTVTVGQEDAAASFYQMTWDDIDHADPDPHSQVAVNLDAGTYVVWDDLTVHYYDLGFDDYQAHMQANPTDAGLVLSANLKETRNNFAEVGGDALKLRHTTSVTTNLELQLLVDRDVHVAPTASTSDFAFVTKRGPITGPPDSLGVSPGLVDPASRMNSSRIQFQFTDNPGAQRTLSAQGDVVLGSKIWGNGGAITAAGDISISGSGSLAGGSVSEGADGLSLYSKGDITLNSYRPGWDNLSGRYGDLSLHGVLYAWGDIDVKLGPGPTDPTPPSFYKGSFGYFRNRGAIVAYGGDPTHSVDPTSGKGNIGIQAAHVKLAYDPKFLGALESSAAPGGMDIVSWVVRD